MRSLVVPVAFLVVASCGGEAAPGETTVVGTGSAPGLDGAVAGTGGRGSGDAGMAGSGTSADSSVPYRDPGCPPLGTREPGFVECDVSQSIATCPPDYHCIPTVTYAEKCNTEQIGTRCVPIGTAGQGEDCVTAECAAGFVCVTGGTGLVCAQLCISQKDCPPGLLCSPLDVDGYGVCG